MPRPWRTRRFFRVVHEFPAVVRINRAHRGQVRFQQKNLPGKILDLSEGGCGMEIGFFIPKSTHVDLFVDLSLLSIEGEPPIPRAHSRITAQVTSCATKEIRKYRLGLQFIRVGHRDLKILKRFSQFHEGGK